VLALVLDFGRLVDLAVVAVLVQYFMSSAALVKLGETPRYRALGGLAAAISVVFAVQCELRAVAVLLALVVGGAVIAALSHRR
jgi:hypothetical protein